MSAKNPPASLNIRLDLGAAGVRVGPGKVALLEQIERSGSIAAAGRSLGMSYRRAWLLIDSLNQGFGRPLVSSRTGGSRGGGAELTALGREVVRRYRRIERAASAAAAADLQALLKRLPPAS